MNSSFGSSYAPAQHAQVTRYVRSTGNGWALFKLVFALVVGGGIFTVRSVLWHLDEARFDLYLHNPTATPVELVVDGSTRLSLAPHQSLRIDAVPGLHSVDAVFADGKASRGTYDVPARWQPFQRFRAVYDVSGTGRYALVTVSYTRRGGPVHSELLEPSARFHVFPDDVRAELDEHFPREISASASRTVRRVCVVRDDGSVPCAN